MTTPVTCAGCRAFAFTARQVGQPTYPDRFSCRTAIEKPYIGRDFCRVRRRKTVLVSGTKNPLFKEISLFGFLDIELIKPSETLMRNTLLDRVRDDLILPLLATASARCSPDRAAALLVAPLVLLQTAPIAKAQVLVFLDGGPMSLGVFDGADLPAAGLEAAADLLAEGLSRLDADLQRDVLTVTSSGRADVVVSLRPDRGEGVVYLVTRGDLTSPIELCRLQGGTAMETRH